MKKLLAILLIVSMMLSFAACGGGGGIGPGPGPGTGTDYDFIDNLPDELNGRYAGEEFVVAVDSNYHYELYGEEDSTDTVDALVYKRNQLVQQRFGCEIVADETQASGLEDLTSHYDYVRESMERGSAEFDLVMLMAYQTGKLITSGYYLDWRSFTKYSKASIEAGAEWWPKELNEGATIMGHQYLAVSDLCLTTMEMCYSVLFNKDMESGENVAKKQFNKDTLYQAVDAGEWTLDAFYNIVKDFYRDNTEAGTVGTKDENDRYGLAAGGSTDSDAWCFALGFQYILNDGVNQPELWTVTTKTSTAIELLRDLIGSEATYGTTWGDQYSKRTQFFVDGRALFNLSTLEQLKRETFHQMDSDYGVLPYPKFDKNQKDYYTGTMDHYTMLSIPLYNTDAKIEMADVLVEALSAESAHTVRDAYFESILKYNSTRDKDSVRMIQKIMDGRRYDITTYHYTEISNMGTDNSSLGLYFRVLIRTNLTEDAATYWQSIMVGCNNGFERLISSYMDIFG